MAYNGMEIYIESLFKDYVIVKVPKGLKLYRQSYPKTAH